MWFSQSSSFLFSVHCCMYSQAGTAAGGLARRAGRRARRRTARGSCRCSSRPPAWRSRRPTDLETNTVSWTNTFDSKVRVPLANSTWEMTSASSLLPDKRWQPRGVWLTYEQPVPFVQVWLTYEQPIPFVQPSTRQQAPHHRVRAVPHVEYLVYLELACLLKTIIKLAIYIN